MNLLLLCSTLATIALFSLGDTARLSTVFPDQGPSAFGTFDIEGDQGQRLHIEFHAATFPDGTTKGEATFRDDSEIQIGDTSDADSQEEQLKRLSFKAEFDCLVVYGSKAVMAGTVTEATWQRYIGRRVLVVAEDHEGSLASSKRDKVTWGIYRKPPPDRITSDAERPEELSGRTWLATDAERSEDEGIFSSQRTTIGCESFPLSSFTFVTAKQAKGMAQVRAR